MKKIKINFALKTKRGIRNENQDAIMCAYNKSSHFCAIVCDGVGSIEGSQYASKLVAEVITKEFAKTKVIEDISRWFKSTLDMALKLLDIESKKREMPGISTTLAMLIVANKNYYVINIGGTRIYQITKNNVKQLSYDHNYKNYLLRQNADAEFIKKEHTKWKCLTNFIDASHPSAAGFDANNGVIQEKMIFLLCTDGMYNSLGTNEIYKMLWEKKSLSVDTKTNSLVNYCLKKDNSDNISCIVVSAK